MARAQLFCGDSREVLRQFEDCSIDGVVSDPPYALVSIQRRFGAANATPAQGGQTGVYARASAGFMGQNWDTGETAFDPAFWAEVWRVLKPGAHLAAFGGTRTCHRLACAIEDGGFEIRDQLAWVYGSGFPHSHKQTGAWDGWGTKLKPAFEPIVLARKPLDGTVAENLARWGVGALNIDACRIASEGGSGRRTGEASADRNYTDRGGTNFAMKPGPRGGDQRGRWPANLIHDGSEEVVQAFPRAPGQQGCITGAEPSRLTKNTKGGFSGSRRKPSSPRTDSGSAARFFYAAKASSAERAGSKHPTVKPVALKRWLCRMIAPPGAVILDPFAGTGTTGQAAVMEGQHALLIEREPQYCADIERRLAGAAA